MRKSVSLIALGSLGLLAACGESDMLRVEEMFGDVFARAFMQAQTTDPLSSQELLAFNTQSPLSLTTDPIDF